MKINGLDTQILVVMTLSELIATIHKEIKKRDFLYEHTPANKELFNHKCVGTYEAVLTGHGNEKFLIPQVGTLHFLYRGQSIEHIPCRPSIYRGTPSEADIFIERMRLTMFQRLLESHPVVEHFFKRNGFLVDVEGLAQHYGLKTSVLDLTSSLEIALFFAMCPYDVEKDVYTFHDDGALHEAIIYVFIPSMDNEPCPSWGNAFLKGSIRPIGLQAFERPGNQQGYGLHLKRNESIKAYMYKFTFTCEDSENYFHRFGEGEKLWVKDELVDKARAISVQSEFSFDVFNQTYNNYRPKGYSRNKLKQLMPNGIFLRPKTKDIVFSDEEKKSLVERWNADLGKEMCSHIFRKRHFNFEGKEKNSDGTEHLKGIYNEQDFRSVKQLEIYQMLALIACPDALEGAEWKNYTDMPIPRSKIKRLKDEGKWIKVPAHMEDVFGASYLKESDWRIGREFV